MKLLSAVRDRDNLHLRIHLDESKVDDAGQPDPAWVYESTWGGMKVPGAMDSAIREASLLAENRLRALTPLPERVADVDRPDTVELLAEPVELSDARAALAGAATVKPKR